MVERGGTIKVIDDGKTLSKPFLDISEKVNTGYVEQGLLSLAFAPDYRRSGLFYVYYTGAGGDNHVAEFRRSAGNPLVADPGSERNVLTIEHSENDNHNGGLLLFGPDRKLYIGLGDGGGAGDPHRNGQSLSTLLGKILRIDPSAQGGKPYGIPKDNPFVGRGGARPEIFEYGLRNPWRFSFDPKTGALLIGDVGQDQFEEVDYLPRGEQSGANLGWSAFEGPARFNDDQQAPGAVKPIFSYGREERLLDHRRLRRPRPRPAFALRSLPLRRLLPRRAAQLHPGRGQGQGRSGAGRERLGAELIRSRLSRADLRDLARGPGLPPRPPLAAALG